LASYSYTVRLNSYVRYNFITRYAHAEFGQNLAHAEAPVRAIDQTASQTVPMPERIVLRFGRWLVFQVARRPYIVPQIRLGAREFSVEVFSRDAEFVSPIIGFLRVSDNKTEMWRFIQKKQVHNLPSIGAWKRLKLFLLSGAEGHGPDCPHHD